MDQSPILTTDTEDCEELASEAGIDADVLGTSLDFAMHSAMATLRRDLLARFKTVRPVTFNLLVLVGANPGILQAQLADALLLDRGSAAALVKKLQQLHWVEHRVRADDRRCKGLFLSVSGARVLQNLKSHCQEHIAHFNSLFAPTECEQLLEFLQRIARHRP
ncbi:MarR family winged helix-turn-helix transcriptional regulator [Steroidobacter sp.]|uniref:MarR family winged helix-turn-helix transcriptional regulator n=1 Tax=Steroidobacter sp. TaxID=1978227 RepID=UPI001A414858|nr:MarR family winged helix-turn-helix transcriptional regulator [Steroidobacter sp.]MBL8269285.1 winged helix-turn-helix transcriptional regulator [Steroidobacter sp.]